jgi:crotonobetainyl-CoA:carnitine CoA-transferase CaiB-like acyl-CoA transferase
VRSEGREIREITTRNAISRSLPIEGLPFEGLRVLDMTSFWAGPSCTHVLAMLGAEVIHVSPRAPRRHPADRGRADHRRPVVGAVPIFSGLNTNKKSVTLDIRTPSGVELLRSLVKTCDVIVENYTPRVLDQIGLDFDAVHEVAA